MGADAGEAYVALGVGGGLDSAAALELMRGAQALAASARRDDRRRRRRPRAERVRHRDRRRLGLTGRSPAATAHRSATSSASPGRWAAPPPASRCSHGRLARGPHAQAQIARHARPLPRLRRGRRAGPRGRPRDDRPLRRARQRRRARRRARAASLLEIDLDSLPLAAGVPDAELAATGGDDYELCFCAAPEDRERIEAAVAGVSWIGRAVPGAGARFLAARRRARAHRASSTASPQRRSADAVPPSEPGPA